MEEDVLDMPTIACAECGKEFPPEEAKCKECRGPMKCEDGTCACEGCGHEQPMSNMLCAECLAKKE